MKRRKRLAALALALCLTAPAYAAGSPFPDVPPDIWYAEAVDHCLEHGLMSGADGLFLPDDAITRAAPPAPPRRKARGPFRMCRRMPGMPASPSGPLKPG